MKRLLLSMVILCTISARADAPKRTLVFIVKQSDWQAIPAAKKQQAKAVLMKCTGIRNPISLTWGLRKKADHAKVWGYAAFSGDAWVLRQKEKISTAKIQQIKDALESYGVTIRWTYDFWGDVDAAGLEPIPNSPEAPE